MNRFRNLFSGGKAESQPQVGTTRIDYRYPGKLILPSDTVELLDVESKKRRMNRECNFAGVQRFFYNETRRFIPQELVGLLNLDSSFWFFLNVPDIDQQFYKTALFAGFDEETSNHWDKDHELDLSQVTSIVRLNRAYALSLFGVHSATIGGYGEDGRPLAIEYDNWSAQATEMAIGMNGETVQKIEGAIAQFKFPSDQDSSTPTSRVVDSLMRQNQSKNHSFNRVFRMAFEQRDLDSQPTHYPESPMLRISLRNHTAEHHLYIPQSLQL